MVSKDVKTDMTHDEIKMLNIERSETSFQVQSNEKIFRHRKIIKILEVILMTGMVKERLRAL